MTIVAILCAFVVTVSAFIIGFGLGHESGYEDGMNRNGWRRTLDGWAKETFSEQE